MDGSADSNGHGVHITKTGISGFDEICESGILTGSIVVVSGLPGTGRSTFGMQFLVDGARNYNENGIYILFEDSADSALSQFARFDWSLNELIGSQKISILDYPISEIDQILSPHGVVKDFIERVGAKRIVIDSVFPIASHYKREERDIALIRFVNMVKSWGLTVIMIASEDPDSKYPKTFFGIERFTEGWVRLGVTQTVPRSRTLEIVKMRGRHHSMSIHPFTIDKNGITISINTPTNTVKTEKGSAPSTTTRTSSRPSHPPNPRAKKKAGLAKSDIKTSKGKVRQRYKI